MSQRLSLGRYVVDLDRGCLLSDGREIPLRPKTFAVLAYLAEHPGQLVFKDELTEAVWPGLIVPDDMLTQSIGELRRALADSEHSLIAAQSGGYLLDPAAAPPERRHQPGLKRAFRWRWMYGILAPLALFAAFVAIWFFTSRVAPPQPAPEFKPAVAVLPFRDLGEDDSHEYFAAGLTQDLIALLGQLPDITVMSWNAVATYQGAVTQPGEIARVLDVRYQVEGSIRRADERLLITAQLIDVQGGVLWSSRFDEPVAEVFGLQERITREIAGALAAREKLVEQPPAAAKPTVSPEAYDLVLRARPLLSSPSRAGFVEARALLRQALALDPRYAAAHAALGETFHAAISRGWANSPQAYWQRVTAHANDALRIDAGNVRARVLLGRMHVSFNRFTEAEQEILRAISANPNDADALAAHGNVLLWKGQVKQALVALESARRIDPELDTYDRFALALAFYLDGQYARAIEQGELNLRKAPAATFNLAVLTAAYASSGKSADAERQAAELRRRDPTFKSLLFANKFQDLKDIEHLRKGLEKAGVFPDRSR